MRRNLVVVGGVLALALGVRALGLDWGLPQVYEEAYPFKRAWPMWGWEPDKSFDLNPHFFNYPTLYFYIQFMGQGVLFVFMRLFGVVESTLDYRVLYALDKTPFYILARSITTLFALGTVFVVYRLGARVRGFAVGIIAATLVAVNHTHITKSQVVEVDVPLTFFLVTCVYFCVRILDDPRVRNYVLAGLFAGLATSTKYSGMLLPLCILVSHAVVVWRESARAHAATPAPKRSAAREHAGKRKRGVQRERSAARPADVPSPLARFARALFLSRGLLLAGLSSIVALLLTSPYIVLDHENFWIGFTYERAHMRLGHFGQDESSTILYYADIMTERLMGWPLTITSVVALVYLVFVRRYAWAAVVSLFPVVYLTLISSFTMRAERYILPLMPLAAVLSAALLTELAARAPGRVSRYAAAVLAVLAIGLALPSLTSYASDRTRLRDDNRTLARRWIEENVARGSYIASEAYGPEPLSVIELAGLDPDVRERLAERESSVPTYAMAPIPMLQVLPELMGIFYDPELYEIADYVVVSSSVGSRYRKDPERFAAQVAFYDELDRSWELVREFDADAGSGPRLKIYRNPAQTVAFSERSEVRPTKRIVGSPQVASIIGRFYQRQGLNLESYRFYPAAIAAYAMALEHPASSGNFARDVTLGVLRCYQNLGQTDEALRIVDAARAAARTPAEARFWSSVRTQLESSN